MTEGLALTGLIGLLDAYVLRGATSRMVVDVSKGAYGKLRHRSWEALYLDAFRQALDDSRDLLSKYAAADGEIDLLVKQLKDALTCGLGVDPAQLSEATLTSQQFGQRLAAALARRRALVIGGHNLSEADYAQIVARLVEQAQSIFSATVLEDEAAWRHAVLAAAREEASRGRALQASVEEVQQIVDHVNAFLRDRFGLVLIKLDEIHQDVKDTKEAVGRLSSPAVPTALNYLYLPPPPDDFVGRGGETRKLLAALRSGGASISGAAKAGVAGMPGVGKTALALFVAHQVAGEYETHIYMDLKGTAKPPLSPIEAMVNVVRAFDLSLDTTRLTADEIKGLYFTRLRGRRALLVLDNAADAWQVAPLLPGKGGAVLVTSRRTFVLPGLKPLPLGVLPPGKARSLLLKICPRIDGSATDLAELCGRLPQALRLAASHLAPRPNLAVDEYLESLRERRARLAALKSEEQGAPDVETVFGESYDCLEAPAKALWRALAVFPGPFDAAAAAAVWGLDESAARGGLAELVRVSMVEYDEAIGRYHLHDLLASFAEARLGPQESEEARRRHARHFLLVARTVGSRYLQGGQDSLAGLRLFDSEWPHIRAGQAWAAGLADRDDDAADMAMQYSTAGVDCRMVRLGARERVVWDESGVSSARRLRDHLMEGNCLGNLGLTYRDLGQAARAVEQLQQALAIARETGARRLEGNCLVNLGSVYLYLEQSAQATQCLRQALTIARETGARRLEGNCLANLSNLEQAEQAAEHRQQALSIAREIGDRRLEGTCLMNLGMAYTALDQASQAEEHHQQALAIAREMGDWRLEGQCLLGLGRACQDLGQGARAMEHHQRALAIARDMGDRPLEGACLLSLGLVYLDLGQAAREEECYLQALDIAREVGPREVERGCMMSLCLLYQELGQAAKAGELLLQARVALRQLGDKGRACWYLRGIGDLFSAQDAARAEDVYREALALEPEDQRNYLEIALLLRRQGREREAVPLLLKRAELAPENPNPPLALASIYRQLGDEALSAEHAARARELLKSDDWYALACLESVCGNPEAALDHLRRAVGEADFDAAWAWSDWDLQWIRDDPRFAEIVGPKTGKTQGDA